jgi:hypothetical protein
MERLQEILLRVGQLNYTWTNTESLLIYLIAGLARTDKEAAIIIFLTLNTTRARIELVQRLSKMRRTPEPCRREILEIMERLGRQARLRNKYNHCIYSFDESGNIARTQLMRIVDTKTDVRYGKIEEIDADEMHNIKLSIDEIVRINKDIWKIVLENGFPT